MIIPRVYKLIATDSMIKVSFMSFKNIPPASMVVTNMMLPIKVNDSIFFILPTIIGT